MTLRVLAIVLAAALPLTSAAAERHRKAHPQETPLYAEPYTAHAAPAQIRTPVPAPGNVPSEPPTNANGS